MASLVSNAFKARIMGDDAIIATAINLESDTIKLSLHTSSFTPSADDDEFFDDVDNEVSSSGTYTAGIAGGYTLASKTVSTDDTDDEGVFDAADVSITGASITARYAVIRKDTGVASTSPIICVIDFGSNVTSTAGTFAITFAAEGILNLN